MSAPGYAQKLAAYQSVATHGGVAASDPHRLIVMLMDGALERIASARALAHQGAHAEKAQLLHRTVSIIDELRNCLDLEAGGELAHNLDSLYEYLCRRLLQISADAQFDSLDEVSTLLNGIRTAWLQIPPQARAAKGPAR
ncbi:MAG: flagellar export chaperone FliS [Pseudomonadales bacterium]|nr:flagellar export chaperone FliS [Pseudomonadales bacterium]